MGERLPQTKPHGTLMPCLSPWRQGAEDQACVCVCTCVLLCACVSLCVRVGVGSSCGGTECHGR